LVRSFSDIKALVAKKKIAKTVQPASPQTVNSTVAFYQEDFSKTLFPLRTNRILIERGETELKSYIIDCLDQNRPEISFSPQQRVYSDKSNLHLRRTVKLDAVAEYYSYDVIFRNKSLFRRPRNASKAHYGYRFEASVPISPSAAYKGFKGALSDYSNKYSYYVGFDIASYFNSVYHHDVVSWFAEIGAEEKDISLGQLLREINSGRSLDCLPQGLFPTKMIGNDFLRFVDNNHSLRCERLIRFMDDIYLFSNDRNNLTHDFNAVQKLVGDKGLSINPQKTNWNSATHAAIDKQIDDVRKKLLDRRRVLNYYRI
jgi:hypothetical protein